MKQYDANHWVGKAPPFSPNKYEIELYRHHTKGYGPICLFGMTKSLQPLCDFMIDINPSPQEKPVIKMDWNDYKGEGNLYSEVVIGDGILNLEGIQLAETIMRYCEKLICRVFLKKFEWMIYAEHFPQKFPGSSLLIPTQEDIAIVVWERI